MIARHLESGSGPQYEESQLWLDPYNGSPYQYGTITVLTGYDKSVTTGFNIPDYHSRKKRGELLPITPFHQYEISGLSSAESTTITPAGSVYSVEGEFSYSDGWLVTKEELELLVASRDAAEFVQAAAAKIYSSGWDALTWLAELKETIKMFRGLLKRIWWLIKTGQLVKIWLEGRYAWRTLVFDIIDISAMLRNLSDERARFSERVGGNTNWADISSATTSWSSRDFVITIVSNFELGLRGHVVADIEPPKVAFNPITTAWELITLSFVVDWILQVGQFLESLSFLALSSKHFASAGYKGRISRTLSITDVTWKGGHSGSCSQTASCVGEMTVRTPRSIPLRPFFTLNLDHLKVIDLLGITKQLK